MTSKIEVPRDVLESGNMAKLEKIGHKVNGTGTDVCKSK